MTLLATLDTTCSVFLPNSSLKKSSSLFTLKVLYQTRLLLFFYIRLPFSKDKSHVESNLVHTTVVLEYFL